MARRMEALTVFTNDTHIVIFGDDYGEGEQRIAITPEQVEVLIEWLHLAKLEMTSEKT